MGRRGQTDLEALRRKAANGRDQDPHAGEHRGGLVVREVLGSKRDRDLARVLEQEERVGRDPTQRQAALTRVDARSRSQLRLHRRREVGIVARLVIEGETNIEESAVVKVVDRLGQLKSPTRGDARALEDAQHALIGEREQSVHPHAVVREDQCLARLDAMLQSRRPGGGGSRSGDAVARDSGVRERATDPSGRHQAVDFDLDVLDAAGVRAGIDEIEIVDPGLESDHAGPAKLSFEREGIALRERDGLFERLRLACSRGDEIVGEGLDVREQRIGRQESFHFVAAVVAANERERLVGLEVVRLLHQTRGPNGHREVPSIEAVERVPHALPDLGREELVVERPQQSTGAARPNSRDIRCRSCRTHPSPCRR